VHGLPICVGCRSAVPPTDILMYGYRAAFAGNPNATSSLVKSYTNPTPGGVRARCAGLR
jgi:hypothetical protein